MEMLRGQVETESKTQSMGWRIFDAVSLALAIVPPTVVATVYAMFLSTGYRPIGYPWQLVSFGGFSVVAWAVRCASGRMSVARLALFGVAAVLMTIGLILFVRASAIGLALDIKRGAQLDSY